MDFVFEWDNDKADANFEKHGVDFVDAARIFEFPVLKTIDEREDY